LGPAGHAITIHLTPQNYQEFLQPPAPSDLAAQDHGDEGQNSEH
jgi:hypothetical protein